MASCNADAIILTEYVHGPDHGDFLTELGEQGFVYTSITQRPEGENQVLVASRDPHSERNIVAPQIHPSVQPNFICVALHTSGVHIVGFRMPAFTGPDRRRLKRLTWELSVPKTRSSRNLDEIAAGSGGLPAGVELAARRR